MAAWQLGKAVSNLSSKEGAIDPWRAQGACTPHRWRFAGSAWGSLCDRPASLEVKWCLPGPMPLLANISLSASKCERGSAYVMARHSSSPREVFCAVPGLQRWVPKSQSQEHYTDSLLLLLCRAPSPAEPSV